MAAMEGLAENSNPCGFRAVSVDTMLQLLRNKQMEPSQVVAVLPASHENTAEET